MIRTRDASDTRSGLAAPVGVDRRAVAYQGAGGQRQCRAQQFLAAPVQQRADRAVEGERQPGPVFRPQRPVAGDQVRAASAGLPVTLETEGAGTGKPATSMLAGPTQVPLVLVVDDSITVRRVTQRLLQREGYRVALAADGLQALERLQEERPTVVLSDIEMPRMDGFDLARNIRADGALRGLPIIMITSRIAEKHREHAMELGVNHYLGKPYSDEELLSLIQHYARLEATAEA